MEVPCDEFDGILVSDIDNRESVLVVIETDLMVCVGRVRAVVHHTLCIVSIAIIRVAS